MTILPILILYYQYLADFYLLLRKVIFLDNALRSDKNHCDNMVQNTYLISSDNLLESFQLILCRQPDDYTELFTI